MKSSGLTCTGMSQNVDPFHASAKVMAPMLPTASHESAAEHETAFGDSPGSAAVGWAVQVLPFHTAAFSPGGPWPTASQKLADTHETEVNGSNPSCTGIAIICRKGCWQARVAAGRILP